MQIRWNWGIPATIEGCHFSPELTMKIQQGQPNFPDHSKIRLPQSKIRTALPAGALRSHFFVGALVTTRGGHGGGTGRDGLVHPHLTNSPAGERTPQPHLRRRVGDNAGDHAGGTGRDGLALPHSNECAYEGAASPSSQPILRGRVGHNAWEAAAAAPGETDSPPRTLTNSPTGGQRALRRNDNKVVAPYCPSIHH